MSGTHTIIDDLRKLIGSNVLDKLLYDEDKVLGLRVPIAVWWVYKEYISPIKIKRKVFKETVIRLILGLAKAKIKYNSFNQPVIGPININIIENKVEAKAESNVSINTIVNYRITLSIVKEVRNNLKRLLEDTINNYLKVTQDPRERYRLNKIKTDLETIIAKLNALPKN